MEKIVRRPYQYVIDVVLTASQEQEPNFRVDGNRDFIVTKIYGTQTSTYTVQFRDSGFNRAWSDMPINNVNIVGTVNLPFELPLQRRIPANSSVYYKIRDTSVAGNTIQIILAGYELYKIQI